MNDISDLIETLSIEQLKALGEHEVTLHLHPEVRGKLKVKVVAEKVAEAPAGAV